MKIAIAQDRPRTSCLVYGMPKATIALQAAVKILDINEIPHKLKKYFPIKIIKDAEKDVLLG